MNFLFIVCDQLSARALETPAFSNAAPRIQKLLQESFRFERAYCPYPLCGPSRAAFWTGCQPGTTGVLSNNPSGRDADRAQRLPTLGKALGAAGYECRHVGKFHDHGTLEGFACEPLLQKGENECASYSLAYDSLQDNHTCERAIELLERELHGERPWALVVDFNNPHDICNWVGTHGEHRSRSDAPPVVPSLKQQCPEWFDLLFAAHGRLRQSADWNETDFARYREAYAYYLSRVDQQVGRVLDALETAGRAQDTCVAFWSDHGDALGEEGLVTKHAYMNDAVARVPLAFRIPGVAPGSSEQPVSLIDILPTVCELARAVAPSEVEGASLCGPMLRQERLPERDIDCVWEEPPPFEALRCRLRIHPDGMTLAAPGYSQ